MPQRRCDDSGVKQIAILFELYARDVTLLLAARPTPAPDAAPERAFLISHGADGYTLDFDGRRASVPNDAMQDLLVKVAEGAPAEWRYSSDPAIQTTFRPLNRILQCINSTPSYQLFLAGFHIGDAIGLFDLGRVCEPAIADSFRHLVGSLPWPHGRKGRLFFIPEGYVTTPEVELELMANGKVVSADLFTGEGEPTSHVEHKLFVPYATPIGFNTRVAPETVEAWIRISDLVRRQWGGPVT